MTDVARAAPRSEHASERELRKHPPFTAAEDAEMARLFADGLVPSQIATRLNRSKSGVWQRLKVRGLSRETNRIGPYYEGDIDILRSMFSAHEKHRDIAERLGRSIKSVSGKLSSLGLIWRGNSIVIVSCAHCGAQKTRYFSTAKRSGDHYCSMSCRAAAYAGSGNPKWCGGQINSRCVECKKPFKSYDKDQRYCSKSCKHEGQKRLCGPLSAGYNPDLRVPCPICGVIFTRMVGTRFFCCSRKCSGRYRAIYDDPKEAAHQGRMRRRARMRNMLISGSHTHKQWLDLIERYKHRCACCKLKRKLTKDHILAIALGGSDDITNIQPLCRSCNCRKGARRTQLL